MCLSSFPPSSCLQGQSSLQQRLGLCCRSGRCFWTFLSKNVPFAAASGVLDLPIFATSKSASTKWVWWLRTSELCAGIPPHCTLAAWSGCLCLLWHPLWRSQAAKCPISQTCFPHLLLDSSVFGGNTQAQKQHCKTIYTETKTVLASSCPIFQLIESPEAHLL